MLRVTEEQWGLIGKRFPKEHIPDDHPDRTSVPARKVLEATAWIRNAGAQWHMLRLSHLNHKTVHRRNRHWCENGAIRAALAADSFHRRLRSN